MKYFLALIGLFSFSFNLMPQEIPKYLYTEEEKMFIWKKQNSLRFLVSFCCLFLIFSSQVMGGSYLAICDAGVTNSNTILKFRPGAASIFDFSGSTTPFTSRKSHIQYETYRAIYFENNSNYTITISEMLLTYGEGSTTCTDKTIQPGRTYYQDFRGAYRIVKQVRILWRSNAPEKIRAKVTVSLYR